MAILFLDDWRRYPDAIIDYKTKNASWLRQAEVYNKMGIRNCAFLLALLQPELQDIDPFDPHLSIEDKIKVGLECKYNPWYYFREIARVPPQGGILAKALTANRGNIALYWTFANCIDVGLVQPRQTGKSLSVDELMIYLVYVATMNSRINLVTKDDPLRKANVDRLKGIRGFIPPYLISVQPNDSDNVFELTCMAKNNKYTTGVAQNSESAALNLGRGLTSPIQHFDEGPFCSFIGTSIPAALAAGTAARKEAEANGLPYGNIFTTTAGKKDDRDGAFIYEMFHESAVWSEEFFDARDRAELIDMINRNKTGRKIMINITMSHRQLGYTDQWLYEAIANTKATGEAADRDFFNVWTSGSKRSPLSLQLNEAIRRSQRDVAWTEMSPDHYGIRWYHPHGELALMEKEVQFIIGLDTSDAVGRDAIAMVITNAYDLSTVGVGSYNETNLIRFAEYLVYVLIRYTNTTLVIERKSSGQSIIDALIIHLVKAGIDPFKRIYNKIVDESSEKPLPYKEICGPVQYRDEAFYDVRKKAFGVPTDATLRNLFYTTVLQNAAKNACNEIKDLTLINEINSLVEKNGKIDHSSSGHDDHVIAWLLTHWFLFHCRNLSHYGINLAMVAAGLEIEQKELSPNELQEQAYQDQLGSELELVINELDKAKDVFTIAKLEAKLNAIQSRLVSMSITTPTLDRLINAARDAKSKIKSSKDSPYKPLDREIDYGRVAAKVDYEL